MTAAKKEPAKNQSVSIENRSKVIITGVTDTDKFNENCVVLYTCMGEMTVKGKGLHVNGLSVESGEMIIEGEINSVVYGDSQVKAPLGFFGKLTK